MKHVLQIPHSLVDRHTVMSQENVTGVNVLCGTDISANSTEITSWAGLGLTGIILFIIDQKLKKKSVSRERYSLS